MKLGKIISDLKGIVRVGYRGEEEDLFEELIEVKEEQLRERLIQDWIGNRNKYLSKVKELDFRAKHLKTLKTSYPLGKVLRRIREVKWIIIDIFFPKITPKNTGPLHSEKVEGVLKNYISKAFEDFKSFVSSVLPAYIFSEGKVEVEINFDRGTFWVISIGKIKKEVVKVYDRIFGYMGVIWTFDYLDEKIAGLKRNDWREFIAKHETSPLDFLKDLEESLLKFKGFLAKDLERVLRDYEILEKGLTMILDRLMDLHLELKGKFHDKRFWEQFF